MGLRSAFDWSLLAVAGLLQACDATVCDSDGLRDALSGADSGDQIELGACTITGTFDVPAGVTIVGQGRELSRVVGEGEGPAFHLARGVGTSVLQRMTIEASPTGAVSVDGCSATLSDLGVVFDLRGSGIVVSDAPALRVERSTVQGPIVPVGSGGSFCDPLDTRYFGLHVRNVPDAALLELDVRGVACGVALLASHTTWSGGSVTGSFGSMWIGGGYAQVDQLTFAEFAGDALHGAVVVREGAVLVARGVTIDAPRGPGIAITESGTAHLTDLRVAGAHGAISVVGGEGFTLDGRSELRENSAFGLRLDATLTATVDGAVISDTAPATLFQGTRPFEVADGLAINYARDTLVRNVEVAGNDRVGVFLDACPEPLGFPDFVNVTVAAEGAERGAFATVSTLASRSAPPVGWDEGIRRLGAAGVNDVEGAELEPYWPGCPYSR